MRGDKEGETMNAHETSGRRVSGSNASPYMAYLRSHWHLRVAVFIALALLSGSVWFTWSRVKDLQSLRPHNPHYEPDHCFDCHEARGSKMTAEDCFRCHDMLTRSLLPNAVADRKRMTEKPCFHPLKQIEDGLGLPRSATKLCLTCHSKAKPFVAFLNIKEKEYVEIDINLTHPIGLRPTETIYPKTLPLSHEGLINCITCHDQHGLDRRMKLMRLYHPGNGRPADFRPLCNDCHEANWLPLGSQIADALRQGRVAE